MRNILRINCTFVFTNLVSNALDAMKEAGVGTLLVRTELARYQDKTGIPRDGIAVIFKDSGVGISPENQAKIYDSFFSTKYMHMGLGLSICFKIIDEIGGAIKVQSELGKGTTFVVFLPQPTHPTTS